MIERHLMGRDITDPQVIRAMEDVPREEFVEPSLRDFAYDDNPLPIGHGQTISQPYIVALMIQELRPKAGDKALEIGAGSGYQAAVLSRVVKHVYTIEIIKELADSAAARLERLGYDNVSVLCADGYEGWIDEAPFDKIIGAAAVGEIPSPLEAQLKEEGRIIIPVGYSFAQELMLGVKRGGEVHYRPVTAVRFVPMTGKAEEL